MRGEKSPRVGYLARQSNAFACFQTGKQQTDTTTGNLANVGSRNVYDPQRAQLQSEFEQAMNGQGSQTGSQQLGLTYGTQGNPYSPGPGMANNTPNVTNQFVGGNMPGTPSTPVGPPGGGGGGGGGIGPPGRGRNTPPAASNYTLNNQNTPAAQPSPYGQAIQAPGPWGQMDVVGSQLDQKAKGGEGALLGDPGQADQLAAYQRVLQAGGPDAQTVPAYVKNAIDASGGDMTKALAAVKADPQYQQLAANPAGQDFNNWKNTALYGPGGNQTSPTGGLFGAGKEGATATQGQTTGQAPGPQVDYQAQGPNGKFNPPGSRYAPGLDPAATNTPSAASSAASSVNPYSGSTTSSTGDPYSLNTQAAVATDPRMPIDPSQQPQNPGTTTIGPTPGVDPTARGGDSFNYQWGSGGANQNATMATGAAFQGLGNIYQNPISQQTKDAMTQETLNAANAKTAGAGEQIERNAAATGNNAGVAAAMAQLGRDRAGIGEQAARENVVTQDTLANQRQMSALSGIANIGQNQSGNYNTLAGLASQLSGGPVGQQQAVNTGTKSRSDSSGGGLFFT